MKRLTASIVPSIARADIAQHQATPSNTKQHQATLESWDYELHDTPSAPPTPIAQDPL
jgi:hypothetical protein